MKDLFNLPKWLFTAMLLLALNSAYVYAGSAQMRTARAPMYDPKTETTITGDVQEVKEIPGRGRSTGTHLIVKAGTDSYEVHIGPTWYLTQQKYQFAKGDRVEVVGSRVKFQGADAIIARQVKKDGEIWTLRDAQGVPVWRAKKH